jgi:anti-sigma B factor antagonist
VSSLETSVATGESGPVIMLTGEADAQGVSELSTVLTAQLSTGATQLLVDTSKLRFADSSSIRALVLAARTLRDRGGTLVLAHPQPAVRRTLELMGADQLIMLQGGTGD